MWNCPYNFNHYKNWLGIGLTNVGMGDEGDEFFNQMYNREPGDALNFVRGDYYDKAITLFLNDNMIEITGIMGTSHKATINIVVKDLPDTN